MKRKFKRLCLLILPVMLFSSCGILGFHLNVHNPKKEGKYPAFDKETIMLGELTPIRRNFDVTFYGLDISVNLIEQTVGGWVEVRAKAVKPIDSVQLDLDQPLGIKDLRWQSREGKVLPYSRTERAVYVPLPERIREGQEFSIHVRYGGKPLLAKKPPWVGGLVWDEDKQGKPWIGVACESEGASIWFPCKDHTSDEPDSAHMRFTINDTSLFVVSNGIFLGEEKAKGTRTFNWKVTYPINAYNITFYAGDFVQVRDSLEGINGKKLMLNHYVLRPHAEKAGIHFRQVKAQIKVYEKVFGEYPWYNGGFRLGESPYAGMGHQTAIAYGNGYENDMIYANEDYIILHETGHEWFGNAVTAADFADVWLQEGFTTYGEALFLEKKYDKYVALSHLLVYRMMIKNKRPLVGPVGRRYFSYKDADVYFKGAWVLRSLRTVIGSDQVFFKLLKTFYDENKMKVTDSKAFIETTNRVTGKDFSWFFDQYLYKNKVPFLEYYFAGDGSVYYRWVDVSDDFNRMPVTMTYNGAKESFVVYPGTHVQKFSPSEKEDMRERATIMSDLALYGKRENKRLVKMYENNR